jgi:hypothetical protein
LFPHVGAAAALLAAGATREASSGKCGGISGSPRPTRRLLRLAAAARTAAAARLGGSRRPRRCGRCSAAVGASLLLAAALGAALLCAAVLGAALLCAALRASERLSAPGLRGGISLRPRRPTRRGLRRSRLLRRLRRAPTLRAPSLRCLSLRRPSLRAPSLREEGVAPLAPAAPVAPAAPSVRGVGRVRPIRRRQVVRWRRLRGHAPAGGGGALL